MLIKIYDKTGILKAELSPENSSKQVKEIQGDNVLSLSFTLPRHIALDVDDYADFMWERYWLTKQYRPKQKSTGEWIYNLKMYGVESLIKNFLVIKSVDGDNEPVFTLTASPREHLALIVKCINDGFGTNDWKVGIVEGVDNIVIDYRGKYCDEALRELAEKVGVEYWGEGTTVNLCRCEHGEPLTLGYDKGLTSLDCGDADNVKFYTRLFPVGSSKNIDQTKYGSSRLRLPGGQRYVEVNADKYSRVDHYEEAAFSGIYPHYTGTVSSVRSEELTGEDGNKFTVYYFKDNNLPFDPNQYEIGGLVKRVSFQEGSELAGLGNEDNGTYYFEVNFDSATREFEIITIWPYDDGTQLPGTTLVPKPGDRYIPWNIRMPDEYYRRAEAELLDAVNKYNADHALDVAVYKAPTDHVWIEQNNIVLTVGRRVRLESEKYFPGPGYRDSRITKITRKVNLPSQMDLEISDALSRRTLDKVRDNITGIKNYVESGKAGLPDIIGTGDNTPFTDTNILSALRTIKEIAKRALSRLHDDEAAGLIKFLAGLEVGTYKEGLSGAKIDADGNAIFGELLTRLKATLAQLQVNGASEFRGQLSSEDFISGFIGGKGWAIMKREVLNALGIPETKYTAEFDDLIVRGTMRVFELVISQLLGENDNRIFTAMLEVDHYDPATGKVWLDTFEGRYYNPFRKGDYIMVQQYNGAPTEANGHYVTKHYECLIEDAGVGNTADGENRLDWVTIKNFSSSTGEGPEKMITKGDTFTRVDNATDPERKGLIGITTVGPKTPYMDIIYGLKTDPDNYLKGRLGNLQGIHHHLFGWLDGFGELLTNLYAVGDFRLRRTGESLDAKIEMLKAMFATRYSNLRYELTEDDNYLRNATFDETMDGWTVQDDGKVITSNGEALLMNGNTYIADGRIAGIEQLDGRNVLHLKKSSIRQANALIRKPGTHKEYVAPTANDMTDQWVEVKDTLYMSIRFFAKTAGTLTIGMSGATSEPGSMPTPATVAVTASMEWQDLQWQGTWDGKGDFVLQYTGDMYVSILSITDRPLDDYRKEVSTQFIQTAGNIRLLGTNINNLKGTVTQLGIDLDAAEEQIRIYADRYDKLNGTVTNLGIRLDAAESSISIYANQLDKLNGTVTQLGVRLDAAESSITIYANQLDQLNGTVTQLGIDLDAAEATLSLHANYIDNINSNITRLGVRLNAAEGSITNYATRISANESAISALQIKTNSITSTVAGVQGDLDTAKSRIEEVAAVANSAGDAKVYNQANNPWHSWPSGQEHKYVGVTWHNTSDGHTYRYIGYDNSNSWEDITNQQDSVSYILQNKDKISTVVGSFDSAGNLTNTSGLVTTAYASQIYATKTTVDALSGRVSTAEASINVHSTQIAMRVEKDGIISAINQSAESVTIQASKINFNGMVTMNNSFRVETNGTTHIGGFTVNSYSLTNVSNGVFNNDAAIVFRNDPHKVFAAFGCNVLPSTTAQRGLCRLENYDEDDWWGYGHNYALFVGSRGAANNSAITMTGGYVSGFALKTETIGFDTVTSSAQPTTVSKTLGRDINSLYVTTQFEWRSSSAGTYATKTREVKVTLPAMEPYDDGHVLFIKRGLNDGNYVKILPGASYRMVYNSSTNKWVRTYGTSCILYDNNSIGTSGNPLSIKSEGDAMCLIYHRDLAITQGSVTYHGVWVQHKFPREW